MAEYIPKYPSQEGDDSNKTSSELLAETLKPLYVPQELMLAWESHLASYSRDTNVLLYQVKESEAILNTQYQALLARVQKYEQMLQDITMDSNEFIMNTDEVNFTGWNILAQASYWDYLLKKEITKLSDLIKSTEYKGGLVTEVTDAIFEGLIADNNYISNVIAALSDTPLIRELDEALNTTTTGLAELQEEYVKLAEKQAEDASMLALHQEEKAEQLTESFNSAIAEQLDRIALEAAIRTQLLQELEDKTNTLEQEVFDRSEELSDRLGVVSGEVTQNIGAITDRINTEVVERNQMIADQAQALLFESEARAAAVSTQADALAAESQARRNAIAAQSEALNREVTNRTQALQDQQAALSSQIVSTNASTLAALDSRATALASDYNAKITNLNKQLTSNIEDLEDGVTSRLSSLEVEDGKLLQNIEAYKTSNNGNVAAIRSDLTALTTAHGTTATKVEGLVTSFAGLDGKVSQNTSSIASEITARSNADSALSTRIDNLTASTSDKFTEVETSITVVSEAITSLEEATATRFTGLDGSISSVDDKADAAINSAATAQETANIAVTTNTAQAEEISILQGRLDITEGELLTKASTDVVSGILTDVSNIEGELSVQATSIEDLNASLLLVDAKAGTANTAAANAQTTANTAISNNTATANRVNTLESNMTQVKGDLATKATTAALELTNTEVIRLDGLTQANSSSITDLSNELVTTNNNVSKALDAITIAETPTNQLPSWYWANHPMRVVNEVKTASVIGVTGLGTKVNLETRVYSTAQANGPIVQRVISATDPTLEMVRRSTSASAWSAWTQPLKAIKDDIATKASSAALSSLDSRVTDIDGRVTSQATSITELESDLTETNNLLGTVQSTAASALDTANAAVTANTAQASDISQLQAKMTAAEGTLARKADATALSSLETKVNNNQTATSTRIDELTAAITDLGEGAETAVDVYAFNALKAEVNTAKGDITSNTAAITDLGNTLNTLDTTVQGIEQETAANANAIQDTSTQVSSIQGQVTSQGTAITNLRSDLTTAQNTANNAASLAGTKADASAFNALNTKVTNIDGLVSSQATDITEIKADITELDDKVDTKADSSALSALTTEVGTLDGKVTTNANAITTLVGRVSTVEGQVATKAEASALSDYYTKVQADNAIAGQITSFSSSLELGGTNQLINSEAVRNEDGTYYYLYELSEHLHDFMEERVGKEITVSFEMKAAVTGPIAVYAANASTHTFYGMVNVSKADAWQRYEVTCQVGRHPTNTFGVSGLEFFGFKNARRVPVLRKVQLEAGNKASAWSPSPRDYETALSGLVDSVQANTTSISNTHTEVSRIGGEVITQGQSINQLTSNLADTDAKAGTALNNAATAQQTANTGVSKAEAAASLSNTLKAAYEAKVIVLEAQDADNKQAITKTNADLVSAQTTLANADTALSSRIDSLVTKVDSNDTTVNSKIDSVSESVTTLTGTTNTRFDSMESELTAVSTVASDAQDAASNNSDAIAGLDTRIDTAEKELLTKASTAALSTLTTNLSNLEGTVTSQGKQLTTLNNNLEQTATRLDGVSGTADTALGNANAANAALTAKADSSVVAGLTSQVSSISGEVQSNSSSITELTNRVEDAEVAIGTKASTAALQALTNEVSSVKGTVTTQGQSITNLTGTVTSQGKLIGDAHTAANNAASLAGSKGKVFFQNTAPPASERLAQNLWIDTTGGNNTPKRWQLNAWNAVSDKVATDALNAANQANTAITTKADVKAVHDLQTNLTALDGRVTSNASELSTLKADLAITNSVVDTKADTSALNSLITEVSNVDDKVTANTSSITSLGSTITTITGVLADKADATLLNDYFTKAEANEATSGQIAAYNANLVIGGVNQLFDSEDERGTDGSDYLSYERSKALYNFYQANLGKPVTISFELNTPVVGLLNVLSANLSAHSFIAMVYVDKADKWTKYEVTTTPKPNNEYGLADLMSSLEFKGVTPGLAPKVRKVQLEAGTRSTDWSPSPRDYTEAFKSLTSTTEANAQAVDSIATHVGQIDGELVSVGESITTLSNRIVEVDAEAKKGITNAATAQSTANTAVSANAVTAGRVDTLTSTMDRMDEKIETKASSDALSATNTEVSRIDGEVKGHSADITKLTSTIEGKADSSAVQTLITEVSRIDDVASSAAESALTLKSRMDGAENTLQVQAKVVDGVKANYMVKMETNGVIGGFGLMQSTGALGQVQTSFGVNADSFFIGAPASKKQPFIVTTSGQQIDGITYPAGTYIDVAMIANATIGTAKINDLAVTNAKIANATIESAKIKSIKADKIEVGNPLVGPITAAMVTGTSLTDKANLFDGNVAANAPYATYGSGTRSATSGAENSYIQVDVGATVTLPEVRFFFRGSAGLKTYIKLKASVDGTNWDYIMGSATSWETLDAPAPSPGSDYSTVLNQASFSWFGVKPYRYLRLYGNGSSVSATNELVAIIGNASGGITKIGSEGILTNSITADKISVDSLSVISANLGTMVSYANPSNEYGARTVIKGDVIEVYDDSNRLRVRLGRW